MRHARPTGLRARRTTSAVAASAAAAVLLSACGGQPGAQETVGPTAGAPSPTSEQSYAPTLPPYTSDVELTDEETAQVEDTLQAIDEYFYFTSGFTDMHNQGIEDLANRNMISSGLKDAHLDAADAASEENQTLVGSVTVTEATVWEYDEGTYGYFGVCLDLDGWGLVDEDTSQPPGDTGELSSRLQLAELEAKYEGPDPVLQNLRFGDPANECSNL